MRKLTAALFMAFLIFGSAGLPCSLAQSKEAEKALKTKIDALLDEMTLEEKVCQLFFVRPEDFSRINRVKKASKKLATAFLSFPVGGVVLFPVNMQNGKQLTALNEAMQVNAKTAHGIGLFIGVDEEGGGVARVAKKLRLKDAPPLMSSVGASGNPEQAHAIGGQIGAYLSGYGFTLDFAPVADVRTDVAHAEISLRAFGYDARSVSDMVSRFVTGLQEEDILAVLKHFPGHGAVSGNSHDGSAVSSRTVAQWKKNEWLPFRAGINAGARIVMISHQTAIAVDEKSPASLSYQIITVLLRGELAFDGVVITDALRMDAIAKEYSSGDACVQALLAGCDMLLLPKNFSNGYNGVLAAIKDGTLSEERIEESVRRILRVKGEQGLLK